ncbi:MAG: tetratricopeptide repeat protein [bacterium]|nr:tetratricopeptide repeat protein [bacterium]
MPEATSNATQPSAAAAPQKITLDRAMDLASQHHAAGRLQQAEVQLRHILEAQPGHAFALHLLGVIAHQAGKTEDAIGLISKAIKSLPTVPQFFSNLGEMCRSVGRLDEAIKHGRMATALDPAAASAQSNLGIAHYDRKEYDEAEACQLRALSLDPGLVAALNNMGSIRRERKDKEGAVAWYRKALAVAPQHMESINNLGAVLCEQDKPEEALEILLGALRINPNYAEAHCNIGNAFLLLEQFDKALIAFNRALALKPDYPEAYQGLARLHQEQRNLDEAEAMANRALALNPEKAEIYSLLGGIHIENGHPEKAEMAYAKALALDATLVSAHLGRGQLLMEEGKMDASEAAFLHALSLEPDCLAARLSLTQVKKVKDGDENMAVLVHEADKIGDMSDTRAMSLHFALGKCYDDTRQYESAFSHYLKGCSLKRKHIQYSAEGNELTVRNIIESFSRDTIDSLRGNGCPSDLPIFVLGMPRSGTTLTEQIIASHPLVHGAGELHDLLEVACINRDGTPGEYPFSVKGITPDELRMRGEKYVASVQARNPSARHITDKMPANFNCLGLIHLMLPNAKIIHVKRNPVDVCLSGFTRLFNRSQHQSYDLVEMARYYRSYEALMEHWRSVLPADAFYEVQYEELVADNENQARALIAWCGLEWNDACLESHKTERNVRTASVAQVRQPIYNSSVERWRKYEPYLGPLLETLGDLVPAQS